MHKLFPGFGLFFLLMSACQPQENKALIAFEVYCEMVANEAKPLALHYPMEPDKIDALWDGFLEIAQKQGVKLHREDDFPVSLLFPSDLTKDKTVVLIYKDARLKQYQQWKVDVEKAAEADFSQQIALARRFGRLLGYTPVGINELLRKNSDYRDLASFGVTQQISHLYYENLEEAQRFYGETLGFQKIDSRLFQISADAFLALHPLNEDHPKDQIKSTAIAFLTDQLAEWYAYVQEKEIPIKYTYKPREGGPHDGFVAIDPGGYLLEFEQFKQHPENELFMALLEPAERINTKIKDLNFYASITWTYHNDLLQMQNFYEQLLGYRLVADQGWTKIYQTSPSGFIGLVDERRGMEDYAETKALELEWQLSEAEALRSYAREFWKPYGFANDTFQGPEKYVYRISQKN